MNIGFAKGIFKGTRAADSGFSSRIQ